MAVLTSARRSVLGILAVALPLLANAQSRIDIKGIYIGMPRAGLETLHPDLKTWDYPPYGTKEYDEYVKEAAKEAAKRPQPNFQIAGVKIRCSLANNDFCPGTAITEYRDGKLDKFLAFFDPSGFADVQGALKAKYPKLVCKSSQVKNAMGASFEQITCTLKDAASVLELVRYIDLNTSNLRLMSKKMLEEQNEKESKKKKDI